MEAEKVKPTKTTTSTGTSPPPQSISTQVRSDCQIVNDFHEKG